MNQSNDFNQNSKNPLHSVLNDDSIIIDFDFKPITDGLGFKHSNQIDRPASRINSNSTPSLKQSKPVLTDLDLFYQQIAEQKKEPVLTIEPSISLKASKEIRFLAMFFDLIFLICVEMLTLLMIDLFSGFPLVDLLLDFNLDVWLAASIVFALYYIGYFSIAEKYLQTTVGKEMTGIKVSSLSGANTLLNFFLRSLISFTSVFTFGLVGYYDLQSSASNTKVVKV